MIVRRRRTRNFTVVGNEIIDDERLALDEMGLLVWLRSRPDDWEVSRRYIQKRFNMGRDKCDRLFKTLLACGWMVREEVRNDDGSFSHPRYVVLDEPGAERAVADNEFDDPKPATDKDAPTIDHGDHGVSFLPQPGYPATGNPLPAEPLPGNPAEVIRTDQTKYIPPNPLSAENGTANGLNDPPETSSPPDGLAMEEPGVAAASGAGPPASASPPPVSEADQRLTKQLAAFRSAYPEPSNRPAQVAEAFAALDDDTRRLAVRAAIGASQVRRRHPKKATVDQLRFLRDPALLAEYARHAPAEVEFVTVEPGTAAWRACALMRAIAGLPVRAGQPIGVRAPLPDAAQLDGLPVQWLDAPGGQIAADRSNWVLLAANSKPFVAWAGLAKRWTGRWPDPERFFLDAEGQRVPRQQAAVTTRTVAGREFTLPHSADGLLAPCEWPPRKDGSLATGPPEDAADGPLDATEVARLRLSTG